MQSDDYFDWSEVSGLHIPNCHPTDRYRAYQPLISVAGLNVVIVAKFCKFHEDGVNLSLWRSCSVVENVNDVEQRLKFTTDALNAIGATLTATAVVKWVAPVSPWSLLAAIGPFSRENIAKATALAQKQVEEDAPVCESPAEIQSLLEAYATAHTADLEADIARHGDPRQRPGYTREKRLAELEAIRRRARIKETQPQKSQELAAATRELEEKLAHAGSDPKLLKRVGKLRSDYRGLLNDCRDIAPEDRIAELTHSLNAAEKLLESYTEFFRPPMTQDAELNARLAALGQAKGDPDEDPSEVSWESPNGFEGTLGKFSLTLSYPRGKTKVLAKLLTAAELLPAILSALSEEWYQEMLSNFRQVYADELTDDERAAYEVDASGEITDASLRQRAGKGNIQLQHEDGEFFARTWFGVSWDREHGYEIEWDDDVVATLFKS